MHFMLLVLSVPMWKELKKMNSSPTALATMTAGTMVVGVLRDIQPDWKKRLKWNTLSLGVLSAITAAMDVNNPTVTTAEEGFYKEFTALVEDHGIAPILTTTAGVALGWWATEKTLTTTLKTLKVPYPYTLTALVGSIALVQTLRS